MSVGFGFSAGDFIATLDLVGTVINALQRSFRFDAAYRELIHQLYTLEDALRRVERLDLGEEQRTQKIALQQAATQCQWTIDDFWKKFENYQPHLRDGGTRSRVKDA